MTMRTALLAIVLAIYMNLRTIDVTAADTLKD